MKRSTECDVFNQQCKTYYLIFKRWRFTFVKNQIAGMGDLWRTKIKHIACVM